MNMSWFSTESLVLRLFLRLGDTGTLHTYMIRHFVYLFFFLWIHDTLILHSFRPYFTQLMIVGQGRISVNCWGDVGVESNLSFEFEIWNVFLFLRLETWNLIFEFEIWKWWFLNLRFENDFSFLRLSPEIWFLNLRLKSIF